VRDVTHPRALCSRGDSCFGTPTKSARPLPMLGPRYNAGSKKRCRGSRADRQTGRKGLNASALGFDADPIVHGGSDTLLAAEVSLSRLN